MVLKCKFKEQYLTFMVNKDGVIIINVSSISMHKKTLFDIELHELIETVNNKIISKDDTICGLFLDNVLVGTAGVQLSLSDSFLKNINTQVSNQCITA